MRPDEFIEDVLRVDEPALRSAESNGGRGRSAASLVNESNPSSEEEVDEEGDECEALIYEFNRSQNTYSTWELMGLAGKGR